MIRLSTVFWGLLVILASVMLYHTSYRVQALQRELDDYNEQIGAEREALHVLQTEWAYLATPARLERLAGRHLNLQRAKTYQILTLQQVDERLPLKSGAMLAVARQEAPRHNPTPKPVAVAEAKTPNRYPTAVRNLLNDFGTR